MWGWGWGGYQTHLWRCPEEHSKLKSKKIILPPSPTTAQLGYGYKVEAVGEKRERKEDKGFTAGAHIKERKNKGD